MEPMTIEKEKIEQLRGLTQLIEESVRDGETWWAGFLEGRGFEITKGMDEHPDWWDRSCQCGMCNSYGE